MKGERGVSEVLCEARLFIPCLKRSTSPTLPTLGETLQNSLPAADSGASTLLECLFCSFRFDAKLGLPRKIVRQGIIAFCIFDTDDVDDDGNDASIRVRQKEETPTILNNRAYCMARKPARCVRIIPSSNPRFSATHLTH